MSSSQVGWLPASFRLTSLGNTCGALFHIDPPANGLLKASGQQGVELCHLDSLASAAGSRKLSTQFYGTAKSIDSSEVALRRRSEQAGM